jgi:Response regulator of the LytR/AlgR family
MKIRIEISEQNTEDEIVIRCHEITNQIQRIQDFIREQTSRIPNLTFYRDNQAYFFPLQDILFFETDSETVYAHTKKEVFRTKLRLYELEEILPHAFTRISKSTIINITHVFTVNRNLTSSSLIEFQNSHKQVYASRRYYKPFMQRLNERSNYENK